MSPAKLPIINRGSFFRDRVFADSWKIIDKQKKKFKMEMANSLPLTAHDDLSSIVSTTDENEVETEKDRYKILLDVHQFRPEEITVRTEDCLVIVEGKHEEKIDPTHGVIARQFTRSYALPPTGGQDVDMDLIECHLSLDGVLQITVPRKNYAGVKKNSPLVVETEGVDEENNRVAKLTAEENETDHIWGILNNEKEHHDLMMKVGQQDYPYFCAAPDFHRVPFLERTRRNYDDGFGIRSDGHQFKVLVDVREFSPDELIITVTDHFISIQGEHKEKKDEFGHISRHFTKRYDLPKSVVEDEIECKLTNGVLEIKAPKHMQNAIEHQIGRLVPIQI